MQDYNFESKFNGRWDPLLRQIIRILSENSRMSIVDIARQLKVSRKTVVDRMDMAQKELGIKYTVELDEARLNLANPHVVLIKFDKKPEEAEIRRILEKSHIPQFVAMVNGSYDLLIYTNAENVNEYVYWDTSTRVLLAKYRASWQPSDLAFRHLGFFPLRNELLQKLDIPELQKKIILLLNDNARISFSEIARRLGMKQNTVAYNFKKLLDSKYIKKFTLVIRNPPPVSVMAMCGKYVIGEGFESASMRVRKEVTLLDDKLPLVSRCLFSARLVGSWDFFFIGVYDDYETAVKRMIKVYRNGFRDHGVKTIHGTITKVLIGDLPARSLEPQKEFNMIRWVPGVQPVVEKPINTTAMA